MYDPMVFGGGAKQHFTYKKVLGELVPVPDGGEFATEQLMTFFKHALKFERKMLKSCERKFAQSRASAFKKKAKTYLSGKRCVLANMFEDNARRPLHQRLSLPQTKALYEAYNILKCLDEPVTVRQSRSHLVSAHAR